MRPRLHTLDPVLGDLVSKLADQTATVVAMGVAEWAAKRLGLGLGFPSDEAELSRFADALDAAYLGVLDMADRGEATNEDVLETFVKARTARAVLYGMQGNAADAIYESAIATDDLRGVNTVLRQLIAELQNSFN